MSEVEYDDKFFPAATHADQEAIMEGRAGEPTVLGTVPFSSPEPHTDGLRMLPLEDGTSAHQASVDAAEARENTADPYKGVKVGELKQMVADRGLEAESNKKDDLLAALRADDADGMLASDFIDKINAATTQEELDAVGELYDASEKSLSSVESAFDKKQEELNSDDDQ